MPKRVDPLSPSAVANAKPQPKPYKLSDGGGLFLLVQPSGAKWWRWKYRRPETHKENALSLGIFPDVSLRKARARRDEARKLLADGIDPGDQRKATRAADVDTFEAVAREWFARHAPKWAPSHADKVIRRLERDVFPWIGDKAMAKLKAPDVLAVLRRIESRNAVETAHRAHQNCGQVFRYAVATGRAEGDVTRDLRGSLTPWKPQHYASMTDPDQVGGLLRAIDGFTGSYVVAALLKLSPLVFTRPGEVREAAWAEFDLDKAEWNIPAERMKLRLPHAVPLAPQAVAILRDLYPLTGASHYVFPGARSTKRPLSNMTVNAALRRLGYDKDTMTAHGFRAIARTILDEVLGFRVDIIEHQLAHAVKDANGRAYNRTSFLPQRRKMMDAWGEYLDGLRVTPSKVVSIKRKA